MTPFEVPGLSALEMRIGALEAVSEMKTSENFTDIFDSANEKDKAIEQLIISLKSELTAHKSFTESSFSDIRISLAQ